MYVIQCTRASGRLGFDRHGPAEPCRPAALLLLTYMGLSARVDFASCRNCGSDGIPLTRLPPRGALREAVVEWPAILAAVAGTALISTMAGWGAGMRILGSKPLEILRDE